jgi:sugar-specific transcriptional regulator TrmB
MSIHALQSLGLSKTESDLYELLLKLGEVPVADIIQRSELKRPTVYKALYALEKKGLVSQKDIKKKIHFRPESPTVILEQAESRFQEAELARNTLQMVIPQMLTDYTLSVERPIVQVYEGFEGLKKIYLDTLSEKQPIYAVLQTTEVDEKLHKWLEEVYAPRRANLKLHAKVIVASGSWAATYQSRDVKHYRTTVLVPSDKFPFKHEVSIYGDKVAFMNYRKDEPMLGFVIHHKSTASTMKAWFDLAWEGAATYQK